MVLGFASNIIITKSLGVEYFGNYMLVIILVTLASQFGSFGLSSANIHFVAKDSSLFHPLLNFSLLVSAISSVCICFLIFFFNYLNPNLLGLNETSLLFTVILIPLTLIGLLLKSLLIGLGRIGDDNKFSIIARVLSLLILAIGMFVIGEQFSLFSLSNLGMKLGLAWFAFFMNLVIMIYLTLRVTKSIKQGRFVLKELFGKIHRVGLKAYVICLLSYMVLKSDIFLINYYLSKDDLGNYSLAVSLVDYIYILPSVIGTIAFQRLSAEKSDSEKKVLVSRILQIFVPVFIFVLVTFFFLSEYLVSFVYGEEFLGSVESIKILLVAILFMGIQTIQVQFLNSFGFPRQIILYWFFGLALNLILNFAFIENYGITAVALSTCVSYALVCLLVFLHIRFMNSYKLVST
jgi:O-antigen/teichoic acid export membrane protein